MVGAQFARYDAKALKVSPACLLPCPHLVKALGRSDQLLYPLRLDVYYRITIRSHLNQIHAEPTKYTRVVFIDRSERSKE